MAARRAPSVCLACQARQALTGRRRPTSIKRRKMETLALGTMQDDGGMAMGMRGSSTMRRRNADEMDRKQTAVVVQEKLPDWDLKEQVDGVREALRGLEILWKEKDSRIRILQTLSNPWPKMRHSRMHNERRPSKSRLELPEANAAPIPHDVFKKNLAAATSDKLARQVLRAQLLRCETPYDIYRVIAVSLNMSKHTRMHLAALHEPIMRALYRCRNNVDDTEVLRTLNAIRGRFRAHGVPFDPQFLVLGLKFSARTRNLRGMKKYLGLMRERGMEMTSNVFRATIAKFSIGHRGLGEIRNGRWRRDELLQVLTGFQDAKHLPPEQQYHLGSFLDRDDWQYLHGWIAVLARCRHSMAVWEEWLLWKRSEARMKPKNLASCSPLMTTKTRGDYWFVEQMTYSGGLREAWQIFAETETQFSTLKERISTKLLEGLEYCPQSVWEAQGDNIRDALLKKYDRDLGLIEKALALAWVPTNLDDEAEGYHVLIDDQEDVLERLGAEDFKLEEDFGYPYESIVPVRERGLHDAAEIGYAEAAGNTARR